METGFTSVNSQTKIPSPTLPVGWGFRRYRMGPAKHLEVIWAKPWTAPRLQTTPNTQ